MKAIRPVLSFIITLLLIEFLDEFIFGTREAAWPLIRTDLRLTYFQIGLLLSIPEFASSIFEPVIGILGDIWKRKVLILGGGVIFSLALILVAISQSFLVLLMAFILYYPATGAFVSLSQAALMDADPQRHEHNMARWTFAGSLGIVLGPLILVLANTLGWEWRDLFWVFALLILISVGVSWRFSFEKPDQYQPEPKDQKVIAQFWLGVRLAFSTLKRKEVLRWLILLEFADLMLDVFHAFLALYFVDVVGLNPLKAGIAVAIWTGCGLLGDFLLIPLLERVSGLRYLRISAMMVLGIFPAFLLLPFPAVKFILIGILGLLNAGWYAIPKGQLYSAMPGLSGSVMTVSNLFNLVGGLIPLGLGFAAQILGLENAMWLLLLSPLFLTFGIPRVHSKINEKENNDGS